MKLTIGLLTCGGVVVALLLAFAGPICNPGGGPAAGETGGLDPFTALLTEQRRTAELDSKVTEALWRKEVKEATTKDVITGRLTLWEAAARFRALARENPAFNWDGFRLDHPGQTDDERHCRQVIAAVVGALWEWPGEADKVVARLEAELEACREPDGTIRLPPGRP
jgi:hypothetical protein